MVDRTVAGVSRALGRDMSSVANRNRWTERAQEWDRELDRRMRQVEISESARMVKRQIQLSHGLQEAATKELHAWIRRIDEAEKFAGASNVVRAPLCSVKDVVRLVECGCRLERLNMGEPGSIIESRRAEEDLESLTVEELEVYRALLAKMRGDG